MSNVTSPERLLAPFPGPGWSEDYLKVADWPQELLRPDTPGYLLHGGPGSGKSSLLHYLVTHLESNQLGLAIGPFDMALYRGQTFSDLILDELARNILHILTTRVEGLQTPSNWSDEDLSTVKRLQYIDNGLTDLVRTSVRRAVLLLDNFDAVHPSAAIGLANRLRAIFDKHKHCFTFILTAESDLESLRDPKNVFSPLRNVSEAFLLLDLDESQVGEHINQYCTDWPYPLNEREVDDIYEWTRGYPALVNALLRILKSARQMQRGYSVAMAVDKCLQNYAQVEPLRTAIHQIEELASLDAHDLQPAQVLDRLANGESLLPLDYGTRTLLAMGILGWAGRRQPTLTHRNRIVQSFWANPDTGGRLVRNWTKRPPLFRQSELSAQGSVIVSLFLDLAPLLAEPEPAEFDSQRGRSGHSEAWMNRLHELGKTIEQKSQGPFYLWSDQARLTNIGYDLNLFREQAVRQSFMPIYEAKREDVKLEVDKLLDRFAGQLKGNIRAKARETLQYEWQRWSSARIQLTRDGAIHLALVRDLAHPLPVMQIQSDLLGLEQELNGGELRELSVQWELALAIVEIFMNQIAGESYPEIPLLKLKWKGPDPPQKDQSLYPVRDRYVIFLLRKLCNCRTGGLRRSGRRLIQLDELEPLRREIEKPLTPAQEEAYNYGRELSCLLEGVMIQEISEDGDTEMGRFPELKLHEVQRLLKRDFSSWQNELFLASLDNALFVFQGTRKLAEKNKTSAGETVTGQNIADFHCRVCNDWEQYTVKELYFPQRTVSYDDYWQCVALGIQYVIELRWGAQWVARRTNHDLAQMADLMEERVEKRPWPEVEKLGQHLALTTRLLSHLRDASIPMFISGADYAARKYEYLIQVSGLRDTILNAEKNIEAINRFLNHHEEQRTHLRSEKLSSMIGWAGGILAFVAIIVVLPSLWIDFEDSAIWRALTLSPRHKDFPDPILLYVLIITSVLILVLTAIVGFLFFRHVRKLRRE